MLAETLIRERFVGYPTRVCATLRGQQVIPRIEEARFDAPPEVEIDLLGGGEFLCIVTRRYFLDNVTDRELIFTSV